MTRVTGGWVSLTGGWLEYVTSSAKVASQVVAYCHSRELAVCAEEVNGTWIIDVNGAELEDELTLDELFIP